jgi:hypothetical protein
VSAELTGIYRERTARRGAFPGISNDLQATICNNEHGELVLFCGFHTSLFRIVVALFPPLLSHCSGARLAREKMPANI